MRTLSLVLSIRRVALVFVLCFSEQAVALEFTVHANDKSKTLTAVLASGPVEEGDTERLAEFLRRSTIKKNVAVYLSSPGGNLEEGIRLGLFFKEQRIKTVVEGGEYCASACALAFLGGTDSNGSPWRSSSTNSQLGFHAFKGLSNEMNSDDLQQVVARILEYGKRVSAPIDLLIKGFATPSESIFWVPNEDICALGIKLWSNETKRFVCNG